MAYKNYVKLLSKAISLNWQRLFSLLLTSSYPMHTHPGIKGPKAASRAAFGHHQHFLILKLLLDKNLLN
jgi:hypothetical protein